MAPWLCRRRSPAVALLAWASLLPGAGGSCISRSKSALLTCCGAGTNRGSTIAVVNNNLGMLGPDARSSPADIRFSGIAAGSGGGDTPRRVDLAVSAMSEYATDSPGNNGLFGRLMQINLSPGSEVDLSLVFRDTENDRKVIAKELVLSVYDLDQDFGGTSRAEVSSQNYEESFLSTSTELRRTVEPGSGVTWFSGSKRAEIPDPPQDPSILTPEQEAKMVAFRFRNVHTVALSFRVTPGRRSHNFLFSVEICVSCGAEEQPSPTPETMKVLVPMQPSESSETVTYTMADPVVPWKVAGARVCHGHETEWGDCPDLPSCSTCIPIDCQFAEWGQWYDAGGCTGLCFRHRGIVEPNNECGKPCMGFEEETKLCIKSECMPAQPRDCMLSQWQDWTSCSSSQKQRRREIAMQPLHGGKACEGPLLEVAACGVARPLDCVLNAWNVWTSCSATCGRGWQDRMRRIVQFAEDGGQPCVGSLRQMRNCTAVPCPGQPCLLADWQDWVGCDTLSPHQRTRNREIAQLSFGDSEEGCAGLLSETEACRKDPPSDCVLSPWSVWDECDKSCDGGQMYRTRRVESPARNGGRCQASCLREARPCNTQPCNDIARACVLSEWGDWSECSANCEPGVRKRHRKIVTRAGPGGVGCRAPLEEVASCHLLNCGISDCRWADWEHWSACTCTCGGGIRHRGRQVAVAPTHGGRLCDAVDKTESAPCNTQPCDQVCVDGLWGAWSLWTDCSATCGTGFRWRHRDIQTQASSCGKPARGHGQEWELCVGNGAMGVCGDRDCQLSAWNEWSDCSCTCFGVRERARIVSEFQTGNGKPCIDQPLKMVEACNPATGENAPSECVDRTTDCILGEWSDWTECPVTCGGGNRQRSRHILAPSANNGKPCSAPLEETLPCGTAKCSETQCVDCLWGPWSDWGACSKCGDQRYRHRSVEQLPNYCGTRCEARIAKEVSNCTSNCVHVHYCTWKDWSAWSGCSAECGSATKMRQRSLGLVKNKPVDYIFKVDVRDGAATCAGTQMDIAECLPVKPCYDGCVPVPCLFGAWGDWQQPTCLGLCERSRVIVQMNNECGAPCDGPLETTKRCTKDCTKTRDCVLSAWGSWSDPDTLDEGGQRYRSRSVQEVPLNGGQPCRGALRETREANSLTGVPRRDCALGDWQDWTTCTKSCGGGWHVRSRDIRRPASAGGLPCEDSLEQGEECATQPCERTDCVVGDWREWSSCVAAKQQYRTRSIVQLPTDGGRPCGGQHSPVPLSMTRPCGTKILDCVVSQWTSWDACDKTCGGGEQQRHRQVEVYPSEAGRACPENLRELQGCNTHPCSAVDCMVGEWSQWGQCSAKCGTGQQQRFREIAQPCARRGKPCDLSLSETRLCLDNAGLPLPSCGSIDCLWGEWTDWSGCSCSCGGGQRSRSRNIDRVPQDGGAMCEARHKEEVAPCNTQTCENLECEDGAWGQWEDWNSCSNSCGGGLKFRHRKIEKEANDCGKPATGLSRDTALCNENVPCTENVDCLFGEWSRWSDCTRTCDGIKWRSRPIAVHGRGTGQWCVGPTKETTPCNPAPGEDPPEPCMPFSRTDCVLGEWGTWSECSCSCGLGQARRERSVAEEARYGGKACEGPLAETRACVAQVCPRVPNPVDCQWGDWSDWGACSKCGGQRTRFRHVIAEASDGGKVCEPGAAEEVSNCPRHCHEPSYCVWDNWGQWSQCTATCGTGGKRSRQRSLALKKASELPTGLYEDVGGEAAHMGFLPWFISQGLRLEVLAAFACGYFGRTVALAASRAWSRQGGEARVAATPRAAWPRAAGLVDSWLTSGSSSNAYRPVSVGPVEAELEA